MSNQIVISSGAKVRNLSGVLTGTAGIVNALGINVANGIPQLDGSGKILVSQLPNSVMEYKGTWNAATNTPTLANGTGNQGDVYLVSVAGTVNFGAGPITFAVGDQVIYSGTIWQKAGGSTGTVTSVAVTESGDALTITGSPITTSGTINIGFAGTSGQYVNGAGGLTTFPTLLSSVGLSMPSAFTVTNSPLTANGTIAVTGAGTTAQYVRGDGSLATLPTAAQEAKRLITEVYNSTGATLTKGTVVYINGGQGNLPTITKAQANSDANSAQTYGVVQADITNNNNGFVVVIGSLNDIDTQAYTAGTQLYLSGTTAGAYTSTKPSAPIHLVYVGIVVRSHPTQGVVEIRIQNGYELDELHDVKITSVANNQGIFYNSSNDLWENKSIATVLGYTPQAQLTLTTTGTSGAATLVGATLNIPNYSPDLSGYVPYTGATANLNLGTFGITSGGISSNGIAVSQSGAISASSGATTINGSSNGIRINPSTSSSNTFSFPTSATNTYTFPNATGTIALTSNIPSNIITGSGTTSYVPKFTASGTIGNSIIYDLGTRIAIGGTSATDGVLTVQSDAGQFCIQSNTTPGKQLQIGYDHISNNSYLSSLNQGVAFTPLFLQPNGGTVGIGALIANSGDRALLSIKQTSTAYNNGIYLERGGERNGYFMYIGGSVDSLTFRRNYFGTQSDVMSLTRDGNVGIRTTNPNSLLSLGNTTGTAKLLIYDGGFTGLGGNGYFAGFAVDSPNPGDTTLLAHYQGALVFGRYSNANNTTAITERMRITDSGFVRINQGADTANDGIGLRNIAAGNLWSMVNGGDSNFYFCYNGATRGQINLSNGVYTALSDINVKKDFEQSTIGLNAILGLKPTLYRMKSEDENAEKQLGFIAQEVKEFIPQAYVESGIEDKFIGLNYNAIVAALVKSVQELKAEIDELKNK